MRTDRARYKAQMCRVYGPAADGYIALQDEAGNYTDDRMPVYRAKETEIRALLAASPRASELTAILDAVGLEMARFTAMYPAERIADAVIYSKDVRVRYSVLWLYYDLFGERPLSIVPDDTAAQ